MYASKMNYKGKRKDLFRTLDNLKKIGLNVTSYEDILINNIRMCEEELKKVQSSGKKFSDALVDSIYAKYLKELRVLSTTISKKYNKLIKSLEYSGILVENDRNGVITDENYAIYVNDVIRDMENFINEVNFLDPNVEIILRKLIPNYIPLIHKELLFSSHSIILSYLNKSGLKDIFKSIIGVDVNLIITNPASIESVLSSSDDFKVDFANILEKKYEDIQSNIDRSMALERQIELNKEKINATKKRSNNTNISRSVLLITALGVCFSGMLYFTNKGIKKMTSKELLATNTTTYSTVSDTLKSEVSYEEKIPYGEKILVVSFAPWEKIDNGYERDVTIFDASNIDYDSLEYYTLLNLNELDSSVIKEEKDTLSARDLYKEEIKEVIRKIQNPNTSITKENKVLYYTSWTIILFSLLIAYFIVRFIFHKLGVSNGLVGNLVKDIINNLKVRRDSARIISNLQKDLSNLSGNLVDNDIKLDNAISNFIAIYSKYRYLLTDSSLLEKYDNLVRRKEN